MDQSQNRPSKIPSGKHREPTHGIRIPARFSYLLDDIRELLKQVCSRVKERSGSFNYEDKQLGLEALSVSAKMSDAEVEVNAILGASA